MSRFLTWVRTGRQPQGGLLQPHQPAGRGSCFALGTPLLPRAPLLPLCPPALLGLTIGGRSVEQSTAEAKRAEEAERALAVTKTFNLRVTDAQRRREILSPNSKQSAETLEARMVPPP